MHPALEIDSRSGAAVISSNALDILDDEEFENLMGDTPEAQEAYNALVDELADPDNTPAGGPPRDGAADPSRSTPDPADEQGTSVQLDSELDTMDYEVPEYNGEQLVSFDAEKQEQIRNAAIFELAATDSRVIAAFERDGMSIPTDADELEMLKSNAPHLFIKLENVAEEHVDKFHKYANEHAFYSDHRNEVNAAEAVRGLDLVVAAFQKDVNAGVTDKRLHVDLEEAEVKEIRDRFNRVLDKVQELAEQGDPRARSFYVDKAGVQTLSGDALYAIMLNEGRDINAKLIREAEAERMRAMLQGDRDRRRAPRPVTSISQVDGAPGGDQSIGVMSLEELMAGDALDRLYHHFGDEGKALEEFDRQMEYHDRNHADQAPVNRRPSRPAY